MDFEKGALKNVKHTLIVLTLVVGLLFAAEPLWSVQGIVMTEAEASLLNVDEAATKEEINPEKRGNAFARALKAPFKAIGRLFGRGKKSDNKITRIREKDMQKFESAKVERINDSRTEKESPPPAPLASTADGATAHLERGRQLLESGDLNQAINELSTAASLDPTLGEAQNLLGIAYDRKGLKARASEAFQKAIHDKDAQPQHLNNLGYMLYKEGDYKEAIKYLKRAAKLAPDDQRIWNNLGLAQAQAGNFDDAYKSFAQAVGDFDGRLNVAARLERRGYQKEAIKHLEKALALRPDSTEVLGRLVSLYEATGQQQQAYLARGSLQLLSTVARVPVQK